MTEDEFFNTFHQTLHKMMDVGDHDRVSKLNKGEYGLLIYIYNHKDATPSDLSVDLKVGSGRIANALKNLEKKGLVIRMQDKIDKRKTIVHLTKDGEELTRAHCKEFQDRVKGIYHILGEEDSINFIRILNKLIEGSKKKGE